MPSVILVLGLRKGLRVSLTGTAGDVEHTPLWVELVVSPASSHSEDPSPRRVAFGGRDFRR